MSRPQFQLVPGHADREPYVSFCGHCGVRPMGGDVNSRVCESCHMGMIVSAPESLAPEVHEAFIIVDGKLQICAVSRQAELLLGAPEADIVQDRLTEVLLPADGDLAGIENMIDMPERTLNNLFGFLRQNDGRLSKRARENEFAELTQDEVAKIEQLHTDTFGQSGAGSD